MSTKKGWSSHCRNLVAGAYAVRLMVMTAVAVAVVTVTKTNRTSLISNTLESALL
jgi:hypothetical protein